MFHAFSVKTNIVGSYSVGDAHGYWISRRWRENDPALPLSVLTSPPQRSGYCTAAPDENCDGMKIYFAPSGLGVRLAVCTQGDALRACPGLLHVTPLA